MASSKLSWTLPRKMLIFLASSSGPPLPSVLVGVLAHKQLSPLAGRRKLPISSWRLAHADAPVAALGQSGPQGWARERTGSIFPWQTVPGKRPNALLPLPSRNCLLGMTAGWKPTGRFLLIQLCMGLLLSEQQRLQGAMCHCLHLCDVACRWENMFCW